MAPHHPAVEFMRQLESHMTMPAQTIALHIMNGAGVLSLVGALYISIVHQQFANGFVWILGVFLVAAVLVGPNWPWYPRHTGERWADGKKAAARRKQILERLYEIEEEHERLQSESTE